MYCYDSFAHVAVVATSDFVIKLSAFFSYDNTKNNTMLATKAQHKKYPLAKNINLYQDSLSKCFCCLVLSKKGHRLTYRCP